MDSVLAGMGVAIGLIASVFIAGPAYLLGLAIQQTLSRFGVEWKRSAYEISHGWGVEDLLAGRLAVGVTILVFATLGLSAQPYAAASRAILGSLLAAQAASVVLAVPVGFVLHPRRPLVSRGGYGELMIPIERRTIWAQRIASGSALVSAMTLAVSAAFVLL